MARRPSLSIVLATYNRLASLQRTLPSLLGQSLTSSEWEVLIVDNASNDGTSEWLRENSGGWPNCQVLYEGRRGVNRARNTGISRARGRFIAFVDDDVTLHGQWAERLLNSFRASSPSVAAIGGPVLARWETPPPAWCRPELWPALSLWDRGPQSVALNENEYLIGTNWAIRAKVLAQLKGFEETLGRHGNCLLSNDEIGLQKRIRLAGYMLKYHPQLKVYHRIPAQRLTRTFFRRRFFWQGVANARMARLHGEPRANLWRSLGQLTEWRWPGLSPARWDCETLRWQCTALRLLGETWETNRGGFDAAFSS